MRRLLRLIGGQAAVETAIILPLMVFMVLGIIQLTLIQQARLMTEHAAFNAARAGIVWNANNDKMVNAAAVTLIPALPIIQKGDPWRSLLNAVAAGLIIKGTQNIDRAVSSLQGLLSRLGINASGVPNISVVKVDVINPVSQNGMGVKWNRIPDDAKVGAEHKELDFDYIPRRPADFSTTPAATVRQANLLTIRTRFLYPMRIPFANQIIHTAWMAQAVGVIGRITGPIDRPMIRGQRWNQASRARQTIEGRLPGSDPLEVIFGDQDRNTLKILWELNDRGVYLIPLRATYSMRMQSNIFEDNLTQ